MIRKEIISKNPTDLRQHPFNETIYGPYKHDKELYASILAKGVLTPIVINKKNQILSGSRRWAHSKVAGLARVPTLLWAADGDNEEAEQQAYLIEANRQRIKTKAQLAKEVEALFRIAEEEAALRMKAGKKADPGTNQTKGRSRDEVAKKVGVSGQTARKLKEIAASPAAMRSLEKGASVERAHKAIKKKKKGKPWVSPLQKEAVELGALLRKKYTGAQVGPDRLQKGTFKILIEGLASGQVRKLAGRG